MGLDLSQTPCHIDIALEDWGAITYPTINGEFRIPSMHGIFEATKHPTDSNKDKLKWCFAMPGEPRPTSFKAEPGSNHQFVELERFVIDETTAIEKFKKANAKFNRVYGQEWAGNVELTNMSNPKETLSSIHDLKRLHSLSLDAANSDIAQQLSGHIALRHLTFSCEVSPKILRELAIGLPSLSHIKFKCPSFSAEHGKSLALAKNLWGLTIVDNKHCAAGMQQLTDSQVSRVRFQTSELDINCFEAISQLKSLKSIDISSCVVADGGLVPLSNLKSIQYLDLSDCNIDDEAIQSLGVLPNLSQLNLSGTQITNVSIATALKSFPKLYSLRVKRADVDSQIIPLLEAHDQQIVVSVSNSSISQESLAAAGEKVAGKLFVNDRPR